MLMNKPQAGIRVTRLSRNGRSAGLLSLCNGGGAGFLSAFRNFTVPVANPIA
jgi:hypothetical protein